jgi:hypothetical protein
MILSVHAVFGAAVASFVPTHPVLAFCLGFTSHLVLDAVPHRDYKLISIESGLDNKLQLTDNPYKKKNLTRDISLVFFDAIFGFCLAFIFFFNPEYPLIFFLGAFGSLLPDFLTFLYLFIKHRSLVSFFNFHVGFVHSKVVLKLNQLAGVAFQFLTVAILIALIFGVREFLTILV